MTPLSDLPSGSNAVVQQLGGGRSFAARAVALGFTVGARVKVIQNAGRGPLLVCIRGGRVALGRGEALRIQVEQV